MNQSKTLQKYINNFRRHFAAYLKPDIGLACNVYPVSEKGAILEFIIGPQIPNIDIFMNENHSINKALGNIQQRAFGGNLDGFIFSGTNVIAEKNRIIFIKGDDDISSWSDAATLSDISKIIPVTVNGKK